MNQQISKNKLLIYLVKESYPGHGDILRNIEVLISREIEDIGTLYYGQSHQVSPSWIQSFFGDILNDERSLFSASVKAVLLTDVEVSPGKKRTFAIPFGYGWTLLKPGTFEERFGLKVTLNVVDPKNLRRIDKKSLTSVPKDTTEQLSKAGVAADFGIDIEQDLIQAITGKSKDEKYGGTIAGKDPLSVSTNVDLSNLHWFLKDCFGKFESLAYKKDFGWIDQISEVRDRTVVQELNNRLVDRINKSKLDKTWMAVPEIIQWSEVSGFAYRNKNEDLKDDIHLSDFLAALPERYRNDFKLEVLHRREIFCFSATSDELRFRPWKAYNCLYCEIDDEKREKTYLLSNGKWYEVENSFATRINTEYATLRDDKVAVQLPNYDHENENAYNTDIARTNNDFCCMDQRLVSYGGGHSSVEFCDLLTKDDKIIHVKHYGGSSVLSHLFFQGVVSGELFLADSEFRSKVNEKLADSHKLPNTNTRPKPEDYRIIFAVISSSSEPLELPFFSKVALRNAKRRLEAFGYTISLQKIGVEAA